MSKDRGVEVWREISSRDPGGWWEWLPRSVPLCSGATGAVLEHLISNPLGLGGRKTLLCFPSTGYIWMRIWHCSGVCAVVIGKVWIDHSSASVTQPQHSLLLSGQSGRHNETFWDGVFWLLCFQHCSHHSLELRYCVPLMLNFWAFIPLAIVAPAT